MDGGVPISSKPIGRGAISNPTNRFEKLSIKTDWEMMEGIEEELFPHPNTQFFEDHSQSFITYNDSPDIEFRASANPYRGCEHGCAYCYARPTHEYIGFSSGLEFETKIMVKHQAPEFLRKELSSPKWKPQPVIMSGVTDCYQPAERRFELTRRCLQVFAEYRNPVAIITKNFLVTRDLDVLSELNRYHAIAVFISITSLDSDLAHKLEPRASLPAHRLRAVSMLAQAGIPVGVMVAPVIPALNDHEIPSILKAAAEAGAHDAGHVILRLPYQVKDVFQQWLDANFPEKKHRVLSRIREIRGGKLNQTDFSTRMSGEGIFAEQIHQLFQVYSQRYGLNRERPTLSIEFFRKLEPGQLSLL